MDIVHPLTHRYLDRHHDPRTLSVHPHILNHLHPPQVLLHQEVVVLRHDPFRRMVLLSVEDVDDLVKVLVFLCTEESMFLGKDTPSLSIFVYSFRDLYI